MLAVTVAANIQRCVSTGQTVNEVYIERRTVYPGTSLSRDIAHHLYIRGPQGPVIILTDNPLGLHAALRKQWTKLIRQVQRERSSTLRSARIKVLSKQIAWMNQLLFTHHKPGEKQADVYLLSIEFGMQAVKEHCSALYIVCAVENKVLEQLMRYLRRGIVVTYDKSKIASS